MATIPGSVGVTGFIAPTDSTDTFPATDPVWGIDGLRCVANVAARNAIVAGRRRAGMLVCTQDTFSYWRLNNSPWAFDNTDWTALSLPAAAAGADQEVQFNNGGVLGADNGFSYNATTNTLTVDTISATFVNVEDSLYFDSSADTYIRGDGSGTAIDVFLNTVNTLSLRDDVNRSFIDLEVDGGFRVNGALDPANLTTQGLVAGYAADVVSLITVGATTPVTVFGVSVTPDLSAVTNLLILSESNIQMLTDVVIDGGLEMNGTIGGYLANVLVDSGPTRTLAVSESGRVILATAATDIEVPGTLPVGFAVTVIQYGGGAATFVGTSGGTVENRQSHTQTAGDGAAVTLVVVENSDNLSAVAILAGDTAA